MNQYDENRLKEHPEIAPFYDDISGEVATAAFNHTSHSPERGGSLAKLEYCQRLLRARARVENALAAAQANQATTCEDWAGVIQDWFDDHRHGLRSRFIGYLNAHGQCASSFITGPANFPVNRNQKKLDTADRRYAEIGEFEAKSIKRVLARLLPYGDGVAVRTDDPDATEKISGKLADMEKQREWMKRCNKIARKYYKKTDKPDPASALYAEALRDLVDNGPMSEALARQSLRPNFMGYVVPFESFQLSNLGANIKRYKERAAEVERVQAVAIDDTFGDITATISDDQKIVIEFPGKPDEDTRALLKSNAFKWSRARCAWVRKLTANAEAAYIYRVRPTLEQLGSQ